jgi:hypothetical protein
MLKVIKSRTVAAALFVMAALAAAGYLGIRLTLPQYPYGRSHCCDKALYIALLQYADSHDGWFPRGQATPEASLSLLYRQDAGLLETLRGKTIPESVVRSRLERGELLTPETCGWHYAEGLRADDDSRLALFWDKVGLGHNGEQLPEGGHYVCFNSGIKYIRGADWQAFLAEQAKLLGALKSRAAEPDDEGERADSPTI